MDIKLTNISKAFDKKPVITGLTMAVPSGGVVCLLGPSGAGKTTLIRLIIGAIAADTGDVAIGGTAVPNMQLLSRIGFMPQNEALYDDLTGEANLRFFGGLHKMPHSRLRQRIGEVLSLVELSDDRKKFVRNYSGGMKKRLSLAVALLHEPDILLLDEPTVGIDPVLRRAIWRQLKQLKERGKTLIVSTHVMDEVSECDKAALILGGQLLHYDTVDALLAKTASGKIEDLFLGGAASC